MQAIISAILPRLASQQSDKRQPTTAARDAPGQGIPGTDGGAVLGLTSGEADDGKHLAAAAAGRADVLVTGDDDLLSLRDLEEVQILPPAA